MDLTINNYTSTTPAFSGAKFSRNTRKAIVNGILREVRKEKNTGAAMVKFDTLTKKMEDIQELINKKFDKGVISFYNGLGTSPIADRVAMLDGGRFVAFKLPDELRDAIKVLNSSNIFVNRYSIKEFSADKLDVLYDFLKNIKI